MRNLKKFLALVLAMVMAFSLMLTASAANGDYDKYTDKENITAEFKEAVQVLSGLDILKGDGPDDAKTFRPGDTITRAEAAAIIYRVATRDTADAQVKIYKDYATFTDVNSEDWFAGYVGYCQNAGYIKGHAGRFNPYDTVTGYEMLTMLLRVVGYGQENEFTGGEWRVNVAARSKELHITDNVKNANFETTLSYAARRDVVADLTFQTLVTVPVVTHNALGYSDRVSLTSEYKNATLGQQNFGLFCDRGWSVVDAWGTPGYKWYRGGEQWYYNGAAQYDTYRMPIYGNYNYNNDGSLGLIDTGKYTAVATVTIEPTKTYNTANVHECDVAHDLEFDGSKIFRLYVNNKAVTTDTYTVKATDTVTRVGGQGRVTKFWYGETSRFAGDLPNWCTMVDTFLAKVTKVTPAVKDPAGHIIVKAQLTMDVYDDGANGTRGTYNSNDSTRGTDYGDPNVHVASRNTDWEYSVGDYVLIQGYTDYTHNYDNFGHPWYTADTTDPGGAVTATNDTGLNHKLGVNPQAEIEKTAFETNVLLPSNATNDANIKVLHKVEPVLAKQTTTYWNAGKHQVGGEDKNDAMTLFMDYAGTNTSTTFAWYYDDLGNIIGIGPVPNTVSYGVITSLWTSFNQGETNTDGTTKAMATVKYANGETGTLVIDKFYAYNDSGAHKTADGTNMLVNATSIELKPVYDYGLNTGVDTMKIGASIPNYTANVTAAAGNYLHVAPVASINAVEEATYTDSTPASYFGIIKEQLFKFVTSEDGIVTAIEVAGNGNGMGTNAPDAMYAGHHNAMANSNAGENKLYKTYAYVTNNNSTGASGAGAITWLENDSMIMVKNAAGNIDTYTLATLPGDVTIDPDTEIDWADTDNDGRAEYIYVKGKIQGTITYNLFYYNGGAAQWNGTTGTLTGWLNGEPKTITFANEDQFKAVRDTQNYAAHLFALQMTNDVVSDVMEAGDGTGHTSLLYDYTNNTNTTFKYVAAPVDIYINISGSDTTPFGLGATNGNPYTDKTTLMYLKDDPAADSVTYNSGNRTITANTNGTSYTLFLTPNTKVIGLGMGVTQEDAILDYLNHSVKNDVTIVYENDSVLSIVEIYVATDPNVTPTEDAFVPKELTVDNSNMTTGYVMKSDSTIIATSASNTVKADRNDQVILRVSVSGAPATITATDCTVVLLSSDAGVGSYVYQVTITGANPKVEFVHS